ncbi:MAG: hypothetical protein SV422_15500, partial [Pseudomonadota bacterium]|nr:hypothetical protein [Pseudomonadota bacterium]
AAIVDGIERLLNCQKKPEYWQDFALLARDFILCFETPVAAQPPLRIALEQAHAAAGFAPRQQPGNALVDPVEQALRAIHMWRVTRWPGQNGRVHFAHTLFNLEIVRNLALLGMRLWDEDDADVPRKLAQLQAALDALWRDSPSDQPKLVRDVRWLFPVAMSPTTDSLAGYFTIAERIASTFTEADHMETQRAWVVTGAGHLRSQLRDLAKRRGVPLDDHALVLLTRVSNALDVALLAEGLVTLMEAYERALRANDERQRAALASAICQGISPDPELFVERIDLLGPYTMIEHLFIESASDADGHARYTPAGLRHRELLARYAALMPRLANALQDDCAQLAPQSDGWSPYGALYGFTSNLLELIAFRTLARDAQPEFGMEDVFTAGDARKRAWAEGWRRLPHIRPEIAQQFAFPQDFTEVIHARVATALQRRVEGSAPPPSGRLVVGTVDALTLERVEAAAPASELSPRYIVSSDAKFVAAGIAMAKDEADLLHCRNEGEYLVSFAAETGWTAVSKDLLTDVIGAGHDLEIACLPSAPAAILRLMLAAPR